jgi:hypothetical protein
MNAIIQFGISKHPVSRSFSATIGELVNDPNSRSILGYGDNTRCLINGVEQSSGTICPDGATIVVETRANSKAALKSQALRGRN